MRIIRNIDLIHNIYGKTLPKHNIFYLTLSMVGIRPRYTYVDTNKRYKKSLRLKLYHRNRHVFC